MSFFECANDLGALNASFSVDVGYLLEDNLSQPSSHQLHGGLVSEFASNTPERHIAHANQHSFHDNAVPQQEFWFNDPSPSTNAATDYPPFSFSASLPALHSHIVSPYMSMENSALFAPSANSYQRYPDWQPPPAHPFSSIEVPSDPHYSSAALGQEMAMENPPLLDTQPASDESAGSASESLPANTEEPRLAPRPDMIALCFECDDFLRLLTKQPLPHYVGCEPADCADCNRKAAKNKGKTSTVVAPLIVRDRKPGSSAAAGGFYCSVAGCNRAEGAISGNDPFRRGDNKRAHEQNVHGLAKGKRRRVERGGSEHSESASA